MVLAHSGNSLIAAFASPRRRFFGVQFHPEAVHTPRGDVKKFYGYLVVPILCDQE
jgi:GMP synthase-like glutamine amidotransferase